MAKVKVTQSDRAPTKGKVKAPKNTPKKAPRKPRSRKITRRNMTKAKRTATAAAPPGMFDESSHSEPEMSPKTSKQNIKPTKSRAVLPTAQTTRKSIAASAAPDNSEASSQSTAKGNNEMDSDDSDDDESDLTKKIKIVLSTMDEPVNPPDQPKLHRFTMSQRLTSTGLSDVQINQYLSLTGFQDIGVGYAALKGNVVIVKSGYIRLLVSPDHAHYAIPNSMTCEDWTTINFFRVLCRKKILIFVTREYVFPKFIKKLKRKYEIPTDSQIIKNYCKQKVKTESGEVWRYRHAHSALLLVDGSKFRLYDANNYNGIDLNQPENLFVKDFYRIFKRHGFPHIFRALGLKAADVKDYDVVKCFYSKGVDNSCANYLLFVVEQMANKNVITDVNFTPSLAQLFARKLNHFVGGLEDFDTFRRNNPYWPNALPPFLAETLLSELKSGLNISTRELNENIQRIEYQLSLEFED